jgi:hypothetical protein
MKPVCQLVFEYIDALDVGDIVTRKNLIKYVADNFDKDTTFCYWDGASDNSIDNYRRIFQYNNILSDSDGSGKYMKLHNIPDGIEFNELKKRGYKNPLFTKDSGSIFDLMD